MQIYSIRGATTVERNTVEDITARSVELMREIIDANKLTQVGRRMVHYIISTTDDVTAFYPARAIRESGVIDAPVFSCAEPKIDGALRLCIRILAVVSVSDEPFSARHVYLHGAKHLREDLINA